MADRPPLGPVGGESGLFERRQGIEVREAGGPDPHRQPGGRALGRRAHATLQG